MRALMLLGLLAAASGAAAQGLESPGTPAAAPQDRPLLGIRQAQLLGAAAGLALGAGLAHTPQADVPSLEPLGAADAVVAGSAVALYLGAGLLKPADTAVAPPRKDINGFDRKIRRLAVGRRSAKKRLLLDHLSTSTLLVNFFQPVGLLMAADVPNKWNRDMLVIAEATAFTLSVNAFVKHLAHRSRPAAHFCESEHLMVPCPPDTRLSFYSGHTSSAFVAAVATGTIADFHHLPNRGWIWGSALTFATATGVLRVMADQHYATDVLTGVAAGGLAGWLIPKLHKPDEPRSPSATARPAAPAAAVVAAVPVRLSAGRSPALVSVGSVGGAPYIGIHWRW